MKKAALHNQQKQRETPEINRQSRILTATTVASESGAVIRPLQARPGLDDIRSRRLASSRQKTPPQKTVKHQI
uniref:hypothetical protein n=1 Tax=Yersinia pseudotuberculosis TaxID=633 RepID=UPI00066FEB72|nr:hypothetical protein [Yersinia pseudotuberculosis]